MVFSGYSVSSINKADRHDITEILLKVALITNNHNTIISFNLEFLFLYIIDRNYNADK